VEWAMPENLRFGRKTLTFSRGKATLKQIVVTEKSIPGEDEEHFLARILQKYSDRNGTIQVVFKNLIPDYAIITFE
jgi:hypothetical protein